MPQISHTGTGGIELELTWKPPPQSLALMASEGIMQIAKEGQKLSYPLLKHTNHSSDEHGKISPMGAAEYVSRK